MIEPHRCVKRASGIWECEYSGCCVDGTCCTCCYLLSESEEKITQVIEYLDRCAIMRVEPNKHRIRGILIGEEETND